MEVNETSSSVIEANIHNHRSFFGSHITKSYAFRIEQLKKLRTSLLQYEVDLYKALWSDLRKSEPEAYFTEISIVYQEIDLHLKNLREWMRPQSVSTPIVFAPSTSSIITEPLGVVLIVAPFNYPMQLLLNPLVGAISAGCCAMLKPSAGAPNTAIVLEKIIKQTFDSSYISIVQGAKSTNEVLFAQRFDLIFFTGSTYLGKIVMKAAATHLTPVILELGGKSPCIVDKGIDLEIAARRIVWGKLMNAGQTCIAPDYILVQKKLKGELLLELKKAIEKFFGADPKLSPYYGRVVSEAAFDRLLNLYSGKRLYYGGDSDRSDRYIQPVLTDDVVMSDEIMTGEIFGPILPIIDYNTIEDAILFVNAREKPLSLYFFGGEKMAEKVLMETSSGGVCINDTLLQVANHELPFGGVGHSGIGSYHGKRSFLAFSHQRSVLKSSKWLDLPFKYVPFKFYKWLKKIV